MKKIFSLWFIAFVFWVFGDLATTFYAMSISGIVEVNPIYSLWFEGGKQVLMLLVKFVLFAFFMYLDFKWYSQINGYDYKITPVVIAFIGTIITLWNIVIIVIAT